jgi:YaiO family outer membrane protein
MVSQKNRGLVITLKLKIVFSFFFVSVCFSGQSQQINTDSLLIQGYESLNQGKYDLALQQAYLGKKISPEYLDFQVLIGRVHQLTTSSDSARYYYKKVLEINPAYEEAFLYLINLELETENFSEAKPVIEQSITHHPENKTFRMKKLQFFQLTDDFEGERTYLEELSQKYPEDSEFRQRIFWLDSRYNSNRIGVQYSITSFDREGVGPWHLGTVLYIGERKWGSVLGRINYANRQSQGETLIEGLQFEGETFFFTGEKSYVNITAAFSDDEVFPKWRLGATFFQTLPKAWEVDFGLRYTYVAETNIPGANLGLGKYVGAYWMHMRSFFQLQNDEVYPAFTLTTRYYYNTRFDYVNFILGYGTSPDERVVLADLNQRIALDSYRIGAGYYRQFNKHFLSGIQVVYNRQEYIQDNWQNEIEVFFMLHYRF